MPRAAASLKIGQANGWGRSVCRLANEQALAKLEEAYQSRDARLTFLGVEPKWDPLRHIPGFQDLLSRMSLAPVA